MSGWRAGLVALVLGGIVLAVGWALTRDNPTPGSTTTTRVVEADITLACPPAYKLACDGLAERLQAARITYRPGDPLAAGTVVIAAEEDLAAAGLETTVFARTPIALAVWQERAPALERACGAITVTCAVDNAGTPWSTFGGPASWGSVALGLADPTQGRAGLEAWRLVSAGGYERDLADHIRLRAADDGALMEDLVLFPSRADVVVTSEVAVASQLRNAIQRAGRLRVVYPDPSPVVTVAAAAGESRSARNTVEALLGPDIQQILGSLGLRPLDGNVGNLLEGLGTPGGEMAPLDPGEAARLVQTWQELVGG
jgi:hypothetical protein